MDLKGGCLCGETRFETSAAPIFVGKCYCTDCQKETGGGHSTGFAVPSAALSVTGPVKTYTKKGGSGAEITRTFCSNCGTTIFGQPSIMQGLSIVRAGLLEDPASVTPGMAIFAQSAQPWDQPPAGMTSFPGAPPAP